MITSKFEPFLNFLKGKKVLITTHDLVDIDAFVSCLTLNYFLNQYFKKPITAVIFSEILKSTKNFINKFIEKFPKIAFCFNPDINIFEFDICLVLDANHINQIRFGNHQDISSIKIPYVFIDHHYIEKNYNNSLLNLVSENYSSTSEIILEIFNYYNIKLTKPYRYLMIAAILTDSGFFKHGNNNSIKNVSQLLENDINIHEIKNLLKIDIDLSEKIAKIKGMQRVKLYRKGRFLIGLSNVSSFAASVASMLIKMGFDITIVYSKEKTEYRINSRARKDLCLNTNLHLGKLFEEISEKYDGDGGGHDGAASLIIKENIEEVIHEIIKKLKEIL